MPPAGPGGIGICALRFAAFSKRADDRGQFEDFCAQNAAWLEDFALFMALKHARGERPWTDWEPELSAREPAALAAPGRR